MKVFLAGMDVGGVVAVFVMALMNVADRSDRRAGLK